LINYALKKTQKQLSQYISYKSKKITSDNNDETEVSFYVKWFNNKKTKRIIKYNLINKYFSCLYYYTNFSGIICQHIFKVAA